MFGTPYEMNANIPAIVRKQLRHLHPGKTIEVINLGASAINSNVVLDLATKIVQFKPDLVLIYMGHNEFYGPGGVGASFLQREFPFTIQWVYALRELSTFTLLQRLSSSIGGPDTSKRENLMEAVSRDQMVGSTSAEAKRIYALFERNLLKLLDVFREKQIPVIMSDITSNLNFPPFVSEQMAGIDNWSGFCASIKDEFYKKSYRAVIDTTEALVRTDSTNAFAQYWLGKTYEALGQSAEALPHLRSARDNDLLKFRAPEEINTIIRTVGNKTSTPCLSSDSLFSAQTPGGIPDTNLFWEHLHPNARGYYDIAELFVSAIESRGFVSSTLQEFNLLPWNCDSLSICWLDLAFADISMRNLTTHWPFSDYKSSSVVIQRADPALQQIAWNVYTYKLGWTEGCYSSALLFQRSGRVREAQTTFEAIIEDNPYDFYAHYLLAVLFKEQGKSSGAIDHYERSINLNPDYPYPRIDLGLMLINQGKPDSAIVTLQSALALIREKNLPTEKASVYYGLSAGYANLGDLQSALAFVDTSLSLYPSYGAAQSLRAGLLQHLRPR
jgi:tetratricopeptide (TPR) repeat protein